jgi:hypothetical protein
LADALVAAGVPVDTLFYPADHATAFPHENQFNLDTPEDLWALDLTVAFLTQ